MLKLAGKYTLARIWKRDDFAKLISPRSRPIARKSFFNRWMQGYDSVASGTTWRWVATRPDFNLRWGRELQKDYGKVRRRSSPSPFCPAWTAWRR